VEKTAHGARNSELDSCSNRSVKKEHEKDPEVNSRTVKDNLNEGKSLIRLGNVSTQGLRLYAER
jgi:hypothetical protein